MNAMEAVRSRRSVRSFDGRALPPETLDRILKAAESAETPYGLPITWRVLSAKEHGLSSPVITGADAYIAGKLRRVPHAGEAFGFAFERVVLLAASMGVGTTWIAGTMNRPAFERAMELAEGEVMPCVSPLGYPAKTMSFRESMMRKGVRADTRLPFEALFFDGGFDRPLGPEKAADLAEALEMVRWAPSAVNKQPWRVVVAGDAVHFYEKQTRGFVAPDGWDMQKIDMGIALCHFAVGMEEKGRAAEFSVTDPQIGHPADTVYTASFRIG